MISERLDTPATISDKYIKYKLNSNENKHIAVNLPKKSQQMPQNLATGLEDNKRLK